MGGMSVNNTGYMSVVDISNMDFDTAVMAVHSNRVTLIEGQLMKQLQDVQARNNKMAKLNELLGAANNVASRFGGDAKSDSKVWDLPDAAKLCDEVRDAAEAAGIKDMGLISPDRGGFGGGVTKGQLDGFIQKLKGSIDSEGNTQQMESLRVQSLRTKYDQAFEEMSMSIKKGGERNSGILRNCNS